MQFRPPVNAMVIEFPAGLVESGETEVECAWRELYEETGLGKDGSAKLIGVGPISSSDAGWWALKGDVSKLIPQELRVRQSEELKS